MCQTGTERKLSKTEDKESIFFVSRNVYILRSRRSALTTTRGRGSSQMDRTKAQLGLLHQTEGRVATHLPSFASFLTHEQHWEQNITNEGSLVIVVAQSAHC